MRINKGMMVEAWLTDDATNDMQGAWRAGEVIWGNGHSYVIRWSDGGPDSERISRKFVRPIPDPDVQMRLPKDLAAGDIVELLDSGLWKWVEVVRVGDRHFDVKYIGNTGVFMVDGSVLRPRLLYGQNGWAMVHKNSQTTTKSAVPSHPIAGKNIKSKAISDFSAHAVKLGKTKRSDHTVDIARDVKRFQCNGGTNMLFAERQEPAARSNDNIKVMDLHPSHYLQETGSNDDDASSKSDTSSSTGDSSSSSRSSVSNSKGGDPAVSTTVQHCKENQEAESQLLPPTCKEEEKDSDESRASARMQRHEVEVVMKQEEQQHDRRVHDLELEAYVSVVRAFRAAGSLTWTREELLSDLRVQLHISRDEHRKVAGHFNGKKIPAGGGPRNSHC
uniref:Uncharacterized protein n=1 Tax=Avena sativa TaxID=4498 RepID=A0ACD5TM06_AVESA